MQEFEGKVALVTGGGNGIGLAAARLFAERGARVAIADLDRDAGEVAVAELIGKGAKAVFVFGDVANRAVVEAMVGTRWRRSAVSTARSTMPGSPSPGTPSGTTTPSSARSTSTLPASCTA